MANNEIMVKDLSTTSSLSTDNKLMLLTDEANNRVKNITVENALANIISSNANNSLSIGSDKKLYSADISGEVGDLDNLITTDKTDIVSAINEVKGDTNAITGSVVPASKGYLESGQSYTDTTLYNDVAYYNHSTFDRSKFTKVGSPIITDDGVVSGFSSSNYLSMIAPSIANKPFTIKIIAKANEFVNNCFLFCTNTSLSVSPKLWLYVNEAGGVVLIGNTNGTDKTLTFSSISLISTNTNYLFEFGQKNDYSFFLKITNLDNHTYLGEKTVGNTSFYTSDFSNFYISKADYFYWHGSIDLKAFSITVDGYPVFNGNKTGIDTYTINNSDVSIPYTLSSTGSKIVDVAYRDRVIDVYQQFGSANYYTIDEINENCTLPMGEIYGFIRQADSDKIYKDLVPCYDSTKAISVPLLGNYTAPADGYVCSPNMVLVLDPDNGYENFSLTIMRNTQSMTMISCTGPTAFPFCLPVLKDDVLTLAADATVTSNVYFIPREGV